MSVTLAQILEFEEGIRLEPYVCPAGHWTIGVGWNLEAHGLPAHVCREFFDNDGMNISRETAFRLLDISIQPAIQDAKQWYGAAVGGIGGGAPPPGMNAARKRACENMAFQLGLARLKGFKKTRQYIQAGDWKNAAVECLDSVWASKEQTPERARRVSRVFSTGSDDFYEDLIRHVPTRERPSSDRHRARIEPGA